MAMDTDNERAIAESLAGRTILAVAPYDGQCGLGGVVLSLDDGRQINLQGWGHSEEGLFVEDASAPTHWVHGEYAPTFIPAAR